VTRARPRLALLAPAVVLVLVLGRSIFLAPEREPAPTLAVRVASGTAIATGVAVGGDRVVTVAHALDSSPTVRTPGSGSAGRARVLRTQAGDDLALLAVPGLDAPPVAVAEAVAGERLSLVRVRDGRISSRSVQVRRAIVAHMRGPGAVPAGGGRAGAARPALELAGRVRPGDSGAPVVTEDGAIAGIVFAGSRDRPATAYAVDASALRALLDLR
jgi:hypothetical protein